MEEALQSAINSKTIVLPTARKLLKRVSVVIPALNEATRIHILVDRLIEKGFSNIVVVNDGSEDETSRLFDDVEEVVVLDHIVNLGPGAATMTGITYALTQDVDYIATIDADLQHHPDDLIRLFAEINHTKFDLVIGSRFLHENDIPKSRAIYNFFGNWISYLKTGLMVTDSQSGIKILSRSFAQELTIDYNGFEFCIDIIKKARLHKVKVAEFPVGVTYTKETMQKGQSFMNGLHMLGRLLNPF